MELIYAVVLYHLQCLLYGAKLIMLSVSIGIQRLCYQLTLTNLKWARRHSQK